MLDALQAYRYPDAGREGAPGDLGGPRHDDRGQAGKTGADVHRLRRAAPTTGRSGRLSTTPRRRSAPTSRSPTSTTSRRTTTTTTPARGVREGVGAGHRAPKCEQSRPEADELAERMVRRAPRRDQGQLTDERQQEYEDIRR